MESGHEQIDTSFEFQSLDLIRGKLHNAVAQFFSIEEPVRPVHQS